MDRNIRTLAKAVTWQTSGLIAMSLLGYLMTGSFAQAGTFAVISAVLGFVLFFVHEKVWSRVSWGLQRSS